LNQKFCELAIAEWVLRDDGKPMDLKSSRKSVLVAVAGGPDQFLESRLERRALLIGRFQYLPLMNSITTAQLATRFDRVERQNRILLVMLCAMIGLAFLGATKGSNVITADEVRTHHLSLINDKGNVVHEWVVHGGWLVEQ